MGSPSPPSSTRAKELRVFPVRDPLAFSELSRYSAPCCPTRSLLPDQPASAPRFPLAPAADILARPLGGRIASEAARPDTLAKKKRPRPKTAATTPDPEPDPKPAAPSEPSPAGPSIAVSSRRRTRAAARRSAPIIEEAEDDDGDSDFHE